MKRLEITLTFILIAQLSFSQNSSFRKGMVSGKSYCEQLDFELVNNKIIVPVKINGKTYRFLFDTGAPTLISQELAVELNSPTIGEKTVADANNLEDTLATTTIKNLKIGAVVFENCQALVFGINQHRFLQCLKIDGFIGSNLFKKSIVKIDLNGRKITLTNRTTQLRPASKPTKMQLVGSQRMPFITLKLEGRSGEMGKEQVLIDTGMDNLYDISQRAYRTFSPINIVDSISTSYGSGAIGAFGNAPSQAQTQVKITKLTINHAIFGNVNSITITDDNSRIGLAFFKYGDVILDFKNSRFYFESTEKVLLTERMEKYSPTVLNGKYAVGFVWDEALKNELQFGNEITRIDGKIVEGMDACELLNLQTTRKRKSHEIEIITKEGIRKQIKIEQKK